MDATLSLPGVVSAAAQLTARVVEHEPMARNTWRMRLHCPDVARRIVPGQFFMIRLPGRTDPLLGRPFALYDVYCNDQGDVEGLDFGYVVVGKLTSLLESITVGQTVEIWGPMGNGFPLPPAGHLILVAGGIGQTPFLAVVREALARQRYGVPARQPVSTPARITLCYGARSNAFLGGVDLFRAEGIDVQLATDDGSAGHHGFVTELLRSLLHEQSAGTTVYCCGPEPMMNAVRTLTLAAQVPCWLSLETPMACGVGACFSCVAKIQQPEGDWDYRRVCVEGPIFRANEVVFDSH